MNHQPIEQDIYNKRIVELMKKKTSLIESLNRLLEATSKQGTSPKTQSNALPHGVPSLECSLSK